MDGSEHSPDNDFLRYEWYAVLQEYQVGHYGRGQRSIVRIRVMDRTKWLFLNIKLLNYFYFTLNKAVYCP
jgi:hypothetical protein